MTTHIKLKWDTVFNAAVEKETAVEKYQASCKEEFIQSFMSTTKVGFLFWKRNYTREEAEQEYEKGNFSWIPESVYEQRINRAKALQNIAFQASKGYGDDNDYVYLSIDDHEFLFGDRG